MLAYIGLGSNLDQPRQQIEQALDSLGQIAQSRLAQASSLYRTSPMGPQDQPDYINAVAALETTLAPLELLDRLQQIERQQGRVRGRRWGERTLDLDLLLYGEEQWDHPRLQLPHPGIALRSFVLVPLQEIAGDELEIPGVGKMDMLLKACDCGEIERVEQ